MKYKALNDRKELVQMLQFLLSLDLESFQCLSVMEHGLCSDEVGGVKAGTELRHMTGCGLLHCISWSCPEL